MEPEDSEPYLNTSDSDATITTTDTEAASPTPPPPLKNKKCSGGPVPPPSSLRTLKCPHRTATTSTVTAKGSGRRWSSLPGMWHTLLCISSTQWGDGMAGPSLTRTGTSLPCSPKTLSQLIRIGFTRIQWDGIWSRPLVDANGHIFAVLAGRPNIPAYAPAITRAFDLLAMSTTTS
ncbi:hypothetical protein B0H16DRAFT_1893326 [Mycena metata]|uniref:Uncharacterized protein n=1 Tax=Mycena metata TaxID=1033252 RepID=A0AAD7HZW5_9AGAR|nr:hypothetical protein B0H16DRAFT_1893326 [Mycena metata]